MLFALAYDMAKDPAPDKAPTTNNNETVKTPKQGEEVHGNDKKQAARGMDFASGERLLTPPPPPASSPPPRKKVDELLEASQFELADEQAINFATLAGSAIDAGDGTPLKRASAYLIEHYQGLRNSVGNWAELGKAELVRQDGGGRGEPLVGNQNLAKWAIEVRELRATRHLLAGQLVTHYRGVAGQHRGELVAARKELRELAAVMDRMIAEMRRTAKAKDGARWLEITQDSLELVAGLVEGGTNPATLPEFVMCRVIDQITPTQEIVQKTLDLAGEYNLGFVMVTAGYADMAELKAAVGSAMSRMRDAAGLMDAAGRGMIKARRLEEVDAKLPK